MRQHPMVKAFVAQLVKNGGKEFKGRFNMFELQQRFKFGYRTFDFRIRHVMSVPSYEQHLIPSGSTSNYDIVMTEFPNFGEWLENDTGRAEYERFAALVGKTFTIDPH